MNKIAYFIEHFRNLGRRAALEGVEKTAGFMPSSRMGRLGLGALGLAGGIGAAKSLSQPDPGVLENMYDGGRDMLSNMSQEDLMGYANILSQMQGGGGYSMGYDVSRPSPGDYAMQDLGGDYEQDYGEYDNFDVDSAMGYGAGMSPAEMQQYMAYYNN